jgi:hypothetical protein
MNRSSPAVQVSRAGMLLFPVIVLRLLAQDASARPGAPAVEEGL